jgi:cell division protein FtsL
MKKEERQFRNLIWPRIKKVLDDVQIDIEADNLELEDSNVAIGNHYISVHRQMLQMKFDCTVNQRKLENMEIEEELF